MDLTDAALAAAVLVLGFLAGSAVAAAVVRAGTRARLAAHAGDAATAQAQAEAARSDAARLAGEVDRHRDDAQRAGAEAGRARADAEAAVAQAEAARQRAHAADVAAAAAAGQRDTAVAQARKAEADARQAGALTAALGPLAERLDVIGRQVGQLETDRTRHLAQLTEQIKSVASASEGLQAQTSSLAGALRSSNSRGTWGEVQLTRIVEAAGMLPQVDFETQTTATTTDGSRVRPDMTVRLPGGRAIAVDAKAPLALDGPGTAGGASDAAGQATEQARRLRGHVVGLGSKQYWTALPCSPEFVVCFVPTESILSTAVHADPTLLDFAMTQKVVLASPLTLLALLKTVAMTWREQAVHENAEQMLAMGRELYQRLGKVAEHADGVGKALENAFGKYNQFVGSFEGRLLVTARRMTDLGLSGEVAPPRPVETAIRSFTALELVPEVVTGVVEDDGGPDADGLWQDTEDLDTLVEVTSPVRPAARRAAS